VALQAVAELVPVFTGVEQNSRLVAFGEKVAGSTAIAELRERIGKARFATED
jgi:hypothetical protein